MWGGDACVALAGATTSYQPRRGGSGVAGQWERLRHPVPWCPPQSHVLLSLRVILRPCHPERSEGSLNGQRTTGQAVTSPPDEIVPT